MRLTNHVDKAQTNNDTQKKGKAKAKKRGNAGKEGPNRQKVRFCVRKTYQV